MTDEERFARAEKSIEGLAIRQDYLDHRAEEAVRHIVLDVQARLQEQVNSAEEKVKRAEAVLTRCNAVEARVALTALGDIEQRCHVLEKRVASFGQPPSADSYETLCQQHDELADDFDALKRQCKALGKDIKRLESIQATCVEHIGRVSAELSSHSHVRWLWSRIRHWWQVGRQFPWYTSTTS